MKKYCVLFPQNFIEYIMVLNLVTYFNSNNRKNLVIYSQKISDDKNIFIINDLKSYEDIKPHVTNNVNLKEYQKINTLNLYLNSILFNNNTYTLNNLYSKTFVTKFMITRQFIRKKVKNKAIILINLNQESIKNIIYYIISLQALFKIEYIKENKEFNSASKINLTNNDYHILIFSQCKTNEKENIIYSKQFIHQLCIALPRLKSIFMNVNETLEELIQTNLNSVTKFILFNISYYNIIYTKEDLQLSIANYKNTSNNIIYPEKILNDNLIQMLKIKLGTINYNTVKHFDEIENKRLINI